MSRSVLINKLSVTQKCFSEEGIVSKKNYFVGIEQLSQVALDLKIKMAVGLVLLGWFIAGYNFYLYIQGSTRLLRFLAIQVSDHIYKNVVLSVGPCF